jgi:DNA polymerase III delta prime subunit
MNTHHAIVCIADTLENSVVPTVYKTQSNDVSHICVDRFSIEDARTLSLNALQKPVEAEYRVFVLVVTKLPEESQNALLKLFEEPPSKTRFYIVLPQEGILIPTLRSRVWVEESVVADVTENTSFATFLSASYAERISHIAEITKKKDLQEIENIVRGAEMYVAKNTLQNTALLVTVLYVRGYIRTPGASAKMLLEELALSVPRV